MHVARYPIARHARTAECPDLPMPTTAKLTPAMQQYRHFKSLHQDAILFFRMGDFYEMFYEDAKLAAGLLGLTLTARNHGKTSGDVPLAGVPHHAMEGYVARLVQMGRKVAICEQVEDPKKAKGVVKRDVVQVVSPGTALADAMLDQQVNNFLVSLYAQDGQAGLAAVDLSTGDFNLNELPLDQLADELESMGPAELLLSSSTEDWMERLRQDLPQRMAVSSVEEWQFEFHAAYETLTQQLKVHSLKGFDCDDIPLAIRAGGAAVSYLRDNQRGTVDHINRVTRRRRSDYVLLDATAQRNLDLLRNQHDGGKAGSLLNVLDQTSTSMGARLLRQWLVAPLKKVAEIEARLDAVGELVRQREARSHLSDLLSGIGDLERMMARVCCQRANARDLWGLGASLAKIPEIATLIGNLKEELLRRSVDPEQLPDTGPLVNMLATALVDDPPASITEGGLIRAGYNQEVDQLREISAGGKDWIARLQASEKERTGISSLKIGYNQVFGYYIEISKANLDRAPDEYMRKQTLANAERFITPELKEYEDRVLGAEERLNVKENALFLDLRDQTSDWAAKVQKAARCVATLDVLAALGEVAHMRGYARPQVNDGGVIDIAGGRHPVVEEQLPSGRFVPNDVLLDADFSQILLLTGPNMAGKSTILRQVGLIVIMAQLGSFVPAEAANIGVVDRIFTRVGAADNLIRGESTFMVEMHEAANILNNASPSSLVLIDELGRGTSTYDGLSIAWALVEFLHQTKGASARTMFATHYHELTELGNTLERVTNCNVLVREEENHVVFLHRLAPGAADRSYGINVAQMAGMPASVVNRAGEILEQLEREQVQTEIAPVQDDGSGSGPAQLSLFAEETERQIRALATAVEQLDVSRMTPLDALNKIDEWKKMLDSKKNGDATNDEES